MPWRLRVNQYLKCQTPSEDTDAAAQNAETFAFAETHTPLERLIHLLSDSAENTLADSGITRLSRDLLDVMSGNAQE